jgi:hypothetical protein
MTVPVGCSKRSATATTWWRSSSFAAQPRPYEARSTSTALLVADSRADVRGLPTLHTYIDRYGQLQTDALLSRGFGDEDG